MLIVIKIVQMCSRKPPLTANKWNDRIARTMHSALTDFGGKRDFWWNYSPR